MSTLPDPFVELPPAPSLLRVVSIFAFPKNMKVSFPYTTSCLRVSVVSTLALAHWYMGTSRLLVPLRSMKVSNVRTYNPRYTTTLYHSDRSQPAGLCPAAQSCSGRFRRMSAQNHCRESLRSGRGCCSRVVLTALRWWRPSMILRDQDGHLCRG